MKGILFRIIMTNTAKNIMPIVKTQRTTVSEEIRLCYQFNILHCSGSFRQCNKKINIIKYKQKSIILNYSVFLWYNN